jgi:hypothetical protein
VQEQLLAFLQWTKFKSGGVAPHSFQNCCRERRNLDGLWESFFFSSSFPFRLENLKVEGGQKLRRSLTGCTSCIM